MVRDKHDGDSGDLPEPPLQILITGRDNEGPPLLDAVDDAVVGVGALVIADQALEAGQPTGGP